MTNLNERIGITKLYKNVMVYITLKYILKMYAKWVYLTHLGTYLPSNSLPAHSEIKHSL